MARCMARQNEEMTADSILDQLDQERADNKLSELQIEFVCHRATSLLRHEPVVLDLSGPLRVCGDLHGQLSDLRRFLAYFGSPQRQKYLFLGNYVDHGTNCIETICYLYGLKIKFPNQVFLLRGNHEIRSVNKRYGLMRECMQKYDSSFIWHALNDSFDFMPLAAVMDSSLFCCNCGIPGQLRSVHQLSRISKPVNPDEHQLAWEMLWSEPEVGIMGLGMLLFSDRRFDLSFTRREFERFLSRNSFSGMIRSSHLIEDGLKISANNRLFTIFSAPGFRSEYFNVAAVVSAKKLNGNSATIHLTAKRFQRI